MPLVVADVFSRFPVGEFVIQVNNRKIPEGFYLAIGLTDVVGTLRIVDKLDKVGPEKVAALLEEAGRHRSRRRPAWRWRRSGLLTWASFPPCATWGCRTRLSTKGWTRCRRSCRRRWSMRRARVVADLRIARGLDYYTGTVYETALVGYESWGAVCSGGRYDALASDGRTTYPGVGISIGVSRILGLLLGKGLVRASGRARRRCSWR